MNRLFPDVAQGPSKWNGQANRHKYRAALNDVRCTPDVLFRQLDEEYDFQIDVAALPDNTKCPQFYTPESNGLSRPWAPLRCWMNPPYSQLLAWTEKAHKESEEGALVVGLLPARTEMGWFHDHVLGADAEIRFIRGRVRFGTPDRPNWGTVPFPSLVVVWRRA